MNPLYQIGDLVQHTSKITRTTHVGVIYSYSHTPKWGYLYQVKWVDNLLGPGRFEEELEKIS